jgi:hypothetical protein
MKAKYIYLGKVSPETIEDCGSDGYFDFAGEKWEFQLEVNLEESFLRLTDSVGRMVPIDANQYADFVSAMNMVIDVQESYNSLQDSIDDLDNETINFGLEDNEFYVNAKDLTNGN